MDYMLKRGSLFGLGPIPITGTHFYSKSLTQQHEGPSYKLVTLSLFETEDKKQQRIMSEIQDSSISPLVISPKVGGCFSLAQWKELELQAFIFKLMMGGAVVPPELVELIRKSLPSTIAPTSVPHHRSQHQSKPTTTTTATTKTNARNKGGVLLDTQPGRCRRTDGRRWRCARDAVEGSKYCAHHSNRGRKRAHVNPQAQQLHRPKYQQTSYCHGVGDFRSSALNNIAQWNSSLSSSSAPYSGAWISGGTRHPPINSFLPREPIFFDSAMAKRDLYDQICLTKKNV